MTYRIDPQTPGADIRLLGFASACASEPAFSTFAIMITNRTRPRPGPTGPKA
ncbi:hypothetical protein NBZ79_16125 [Sneathiella marina]|uniref:Uncharacterized protein n=1 Tax=Sneathiella marina TaxID=2950108 RepID=A0ABY4VZU6_9PROT|nr:hypothetical protein [Sneathiella marina]USG60455.1 hypothetical protein NBZ79_14905 [Sneathiella marina]USG60690.1 hypothetical protein NBZ79_16125 [Sneathiella marina]